MYVRLKSTDLKFQHSTMMKYGIFTLLNTYDSKLRKIVIFYCKKKEFFFRVFFSVFFSVFFTILYDRTTPICFFGLFIE
jgi:hypothetical protein